MVEKELEELSKKVEVMSTKMNFRRKYWKHNYIKQHFALTLLKSYPLLHAKFYGHCLMNNDISTLRKVINLYISYTLDPWSRDLNIDFTLGNCLFGYMKLNKNADPDKYAYSGYGIEFDARSLFSLPQGSWGKNVTIF